MVCEVLIIIIIIIRSILGMFTIFHISCISIVQTQNNHRPLLYKLLPLYTLHYYSYQLYLTSTTQSYHITIYSIDTDYHLLLLLLSANYIYIYSLLLHSQLDIDKPSRTSNALHMVIAVVQTKVAIIIMNEVLRTYLSTGRIAADVVVR